MTGNIRYFSRNHLCSLTGCVELSTFDWSGKYSWDIDLLKEAIEWLHETNNVYSSNLNVLKVIKLAITFYIQYNFICYAINIISLDIPQI